MAYSLHIERPDSSISLDEWLTAASAIDSLRPRATGYTAVNPGTGERIEIGQSTGDLEIALPQSPLARVLGKAKKWEPAFFFSQGRASFPPPDNIDSATDPVRMAAATLAKALNASIIGDEGEEYAW
jgi:hypothetical protein